MSKKWTSWIPHTGDTCPVGINESVRTKLADGKKQTRRAGSVVWPNTARYIPITHYKRLISNAEAEKAKEAALNVEMSPEVKAAQDLQAVEATIESLAYKIEGLEYDLEDAVQVAYNRGADDWTHLNYPDKFERFEKEAKKFGSELAEIDAAKSTTPQPVITGVGEYITRGGDKVAIKRLNESGDWRGYFYRIPGWCNWSNSGKLMGATHHGFDIIGPWPKPEEEVDTFFVGDQVSKKTGYQYPGKVVSIFETTAGKTRLVVECTCPEVAGMLHIYSPENLRLSHTRN